LDNTIKHYGTDVIPFATARRSETLLFVSGQGGCDPVTGEVTHEGDLESQTVQTMENIRSILSQSGLTFQDVLKVNVYLSDRKHYEAFNRIYARYFSPPYPARTLVYCELNFDLLVEIDVIAQCKQ